MKDWWPKVGDKIVMVEVREYIAPHAKMGDVRTVVAVESWANTIELDVCSCNRADGKGCKWSWKDSHMHMFAPYVEPNPITPEEEANAKPLPTPDDVASFFKVKHE